MEKIATVRKNKSTTLRSAAPVAFDALALGQVERTNSIFLFHASFARGRSWACWLSSRLGAAFSALTLSFFRLFGLFLAFRDEGSGTRAQGRSRHCGSTATRRVSRRNSKTKRGIQRTNANKSIKFQIYTTFKYKCTTNLFLNCLTPKQNVQ